MTYTGRTHVGGPAAVHELSLLTVSKLAVGPLDNNVFLLRCRRSGEQLLVDAAAEPDRILDLVGPDGLSAIVTTHAHRDHWGALDTVRTATGAPSLAHEIDAGALGNLVDRTLVDGEEIVWGDCAVTAIHLSGHTAGSIALLYDDPMGHPHLFTGDCLFPGGVGKTHSREDFERLYTGVKQQLFDRLPDETWVYPGYGDDTTLGAERPELDRWWQRGW